MKDNKKNNSFEIFVVFLCLLIVYVFPVSSNLSLSSNLHGDIYYYMRLIVLPLAIISIFRQHNRTKIEIFEYFLMLLLSILSYVVYGEIPWTSILLFSCFILFDSLSKTKVDFYKNRKIFVIISLFLIFQIVVMFFLNRTHIGVMGSYKDANYTGYFLIIIYYIIGNSNKNTIFQYRDIFLILSFLTFSRTAMICVMLIYFLRFSRFSFNKIIKKPGLVFYFAFFLWMLVCDFYVSYFEKTKYVYLFNTGISRLSNFIDYSNYIRSFINIKLFKNFTLNSLLFGFTENAYKALIFFEGKNANPHNMFFAIYQQCGIIFSIFVVRRFTSIFLKGKGLMDMYIVFLIYAMILGPSIYYGIDLILVYIASMMYKKNNYLLEVSDDKKT